MCLSRGTITVLLTGFILFLCSCSQASPTALITQEHQEMAKLAPPPKLQGRVVYHLRVDDFYQIFVIDLASGIIKQLTFEGENIEPSWSPDGSKIAYACKKEGTKFELCLMNADGSGQHTLTQNDYNDWNPRWSPDGQFLVYSSSEFQYSHVHIFDLANKTSRRLVTATGNEGGGRWSPAGSQILFTADRGGYFNLYTCGTDGNQEKQLTDFGRDDHGAWSPDGKSIVFVRTISTAGISSIVDLFIIDANGQNPKQLTNDPLLENWPTFSPDGKWILFSRAMGSENQLLVIPVEGGTPAPLYSGGVIGDAPDWIP